MMMMVMVDVDGGCGIRVCAAALCAVLGCGFSLLLARVWLCDKLCEDL